jgi:hypothetical protein
MDLYSASRWPSVKVRSQFFVEKDHVNERLRVGVRHTGHQAFCVAATRLMGMVTSYPGVPLRFTPSYSRQPTCAICLGQCHTISGSAILP